MGRQTHFAWLTGATVDREPGRMHWGLALWWSLDLALLLLVAVLGAGRGAAVDGRAFACKMAAAGARRALPSMLSLTAAGLLLLYFASSWAAYIASPRGGHPRPVPLWTLPAAGLALLAATICLRRLTGVPAGRWCTPVSRFCAARA